MERKKIAVADLGEFWYGDYKEPFEQLEGGVPGHPVGVVLKDDDGKLLCAFCGRTFDSLGTHAAKMHGLKAAEYKREVGLQQGSSLWSERLRVSSLTMSRARTSPEYMAAMKLRSIHSERRIPHNGDNGKRTPEFLNKTGRCYAQILAVGRSVQKEKGRVTRETMRASGLSEGPILAYFSTWNDFQREVGARLTIRNNWTDGQLIRALRSLAEKIGRTPGASDLRRFGMPWQSTFSRHFGSYPEACRRAGLDPNLPVPLDTDLEVSVFATYAVTGSLRRTAALVPMSATRIGQLFAQYGAPFLVMSGYPRGSDTSERKEWAAEMARRLSGHASSARIISASAS